MGRILRRTPRSFVAVVLAAAFSLPVVSAAEAGPRPGVAPTVAARSASSANYDSVSRTERNRRRYRKKLEKEREDRDDKIRSLGKRSRNKAHQPGGYCMYDTQGNVILRPRGVRCENQSGEYMRSEGATPSQEPDRGCVDGDCRDGQGVFLWTNGTQYIGSFQGGRQHGEGLLILPDGATWEGTWRAGKKHGEGVATYADGRVKRGTWKNDRFLGRKAKRAAQLRWPDLSKAPRAEIGGGDRDAAVVVGITRYAHVAPVSGAAANAADWYGYLVNGRKIPFQRVTLLADEDATVEEMRFAAEQAAEQVRKGGTLWFVFVGHGAPARGGDDGLLVGFDAQQKARSIEARSLPRSELLAALQKSRAAQIQVLIDACFSGRTATGAQLVAGLQPLVVESPARLGDARTTLLTAAGSDEYAGPLPGANRPAFSYLALGGLRGWADGDEDGRITSGELHGYVTQAMRALVRDRRQRPTLIGEDDRRLARSGREKGPDLAGFVVGAAASQR